MGLSDRQYYRGTDSEGGFRPRALSVNTWIIIANVAVAVVGAFIPGLNDRLARWGHLSTVTLFQLEVWRVLTFQFLHAGLLHLFFNMFGLYVFGPIVERHLGAKRYLAFYLICGIMGGVMYFVLNILGHVGAHYLHIRLPGLLIDNASTPLVGASAGVFGVIMACAYISPNSVIQLIFPPVPIRMKLFAYGYVAIAAINLFFGGQNAGGDAAHLGGAIAGYFFIRRSHLLRDFFEVTGPKSAGRRVVVPDRARKGPPPAEVDRILSKVSTEGLQSLTEREKQTLAEASQVQRGR